MQISIDERTVLERLRRTELQMVMRQLGLPYTPSQPATLLRHAIRMTETSTAELEKMVRKHHERLAAGQEAVMEAEKEAELAMAKMNRRLVPGKDAVVVQETTIGLRVERTQPTPTPDDSGEVEETYYGKSYKEMIQLASERGMDVGKSPRKSVLVRELHEYDTANRG